MSIEVNNIDEVRLKEKLQNSDCDLCKRALECIQAYERVLEINQHTNKKAISKIKSQSKYIKELESRL